jgi:hypothetical protein
VELWELSARESIRSIVASYAHAADSGRFDELVMLFAPDGVLEVHSERARRGRDEIRDFLLGVGRDVAATSASRMIRHNVTNHKIEVLSPTEARGAAYFLVMTDDGVDHWGRYRDTYVGNGDEWLFAHRFVRTDGRIAGGFAAGRGHE